MIIGYVSASTASSSAIATPTAARTPRVLCRDVDALYTYLTETIGTIDAVGHVETAPVIRTVKRAAAR